MPAVETLNAAQRQAVLDGIGATPRFNLKAFQQELAARRSGALLGRNNPSGSAVYSSTFAPAVNFSSALPSGYALANALPVGTGVIANYRPYWAWTPGWAADPGNGMVSVRDTTSAQPNQNYGSTTNAVNNVNRFYTMTDDPKPVINIQGGTGLIRFIVDGQYLNLTQAAPGAGNVYVQLDFTQAGALAPPLGMREICVETVAAVGRVVRSSPIYTVQAPASLGPPILGQGDSWCTIGGGQTYGLNTWFRNMADWLGCPLAGVNALGGTGFATPLVSGSPSTTTSYGARNPDLLQMGPASALILCNNTNDLSALVNGTLTNASYQTIMANDLAAKRAQMPDVPIVMLTGATTDETTTVTTTAEQNIADIIAGMNSAGDNRIRHVRAIKPANGGRSWLFGTGAGTQDGNRFNYIGTVQAAHPNDAGHAYYGRRAAGEIYSALMSMT